MTNQTHTLSINEFWVVCVKHDKPLRGSFMHSCLAQELENYLRYLSAQSLRPNKHLKLFFDDIRVSKHSRTKVYRQTRSVAISLGWTVERLKFQETLRGTNNIFV